MKHAWLAIAILVAGMLTVLVSTDRPGDSGLSGLVVAQARFMDPVTAPVRDDMMPVSRRALRSEQGARWLRAQYDLPPTTEVGSLPALELAGPFSAQVFVNGHLVGAKGIPSLVRDRETLGPIDSVIPLTGSRSGTNELLILISSHNVPEGRWQLLQDFRLLPSMAESKRSAAYYWIAISQIGFLVILAGTYAVSAWPRGRFRLSIGTLPWGLIGTIGLILALLSEISRSWINYPYALHGTRMMILSAATTVFGASFVGLFANQLRAPLTGLHLLVLAFTLLGLRIMQISVDAHSLLALGVCVIACVALAMTYRNRIEPLAASLLSGLAATTLFASQAPWVFLDNGIFLTGGLLFTPAAISALKRRLAPAPEPQVIRLETDGEVLSFEANSIRSITAAGNYVEITTQAGERVLARSAVSRIAVQLGQPYLQVHRSHIANLSLATRILAESGSKYLLIMSDGGPNIPVSRSRVAQVREQLKTRIH